MQTRWSEIVYLVHSGEKIEIQIQPYWNEMNYMTKCLHYRLKKSSMQYRFLEVS
jgi:hypothetical protein